MIIQLQMSESRARIALYALRNRFGLPQKNVRSTGNHLEPLIRRLVQTAIAEELQKDSDAAKAALDKESHD